MQNATAILSFNIVYTQKEYIWYLIIRSAYSYVHSYCFDFSQNLHKSLFTEQYSTEQLLASKRITKKKKTHTAWRLQIKYRSNRFAHWMICALFLHYEIHSRNATVSSASTKKLIRVPCHWRYVNVLTQGGTLNSCLYDETIFPQPTTGRTCSVFSTEVK